MADVLAWHRSLCPQCLELDATRGKEKPTAFGIRGYNCDEWYEIISEYSEYEGRYAMRGNP